MSAIRSALFLWFSITALCLLPWLLRLAPEEIPAARATRLSAVVTRSEPVSPLSTSTVHLKHLVEGHLARPKPPVWGFTPSLVPFEACGLTAIRAIRPPRYAPGLPRPTSFFLCFFRFVLGHHIAAHAP